MPDIVLIAHGSPDPRHREGLETLAEAVRAADLLLGNDEWGMSWISAHRAKQKAQAEAEAAAAGAAS